MKLLHPVVTGLFLAALALAPALTACDSSSGGDEAADTSDAEGEVGFDPTDTAPTDDGEVGQPDAEPDVAPDVDEEVIPDVTPDVEPDEGPDVEDTTDVEPDADVEDVAPDVPPEDDGECVPACEGKVCGPDGCGSICGFCVHPKVCDADGQCAVVCELQCEGKECGEDGCGGFCGSCSDLGPDLACGDDGLCYQEECQPQCSGMVCGKDGCGGVCGTCALPKVCSANGASCELGPCGNITEVGECQEDTLVSCENADSLEDQALVEEDCTELGQYECAWDGFAHKYACMEAGPCEPDCTAGAECGDDGCGGTCGKGCADGWSCLGSSCDPAVGAACGEVTSIGECSDDYSTLWWCNPSGKLQSEDCSVFGEKCGWDMSLNKRGCVAQ